MNTLSFERRVHECLDLRQDPLECTAIVEYLEVNPGALDAFVDLRAVGLHRVWPKSAARVPWTPPRLAALAAAAALVVSFILHQAKEGPASLPFFETSTRLLVKDPIPKLLSLQVTRPTSFSSQQVISHPSRPSVRVLSVRTSTTRNIP